MADYLKIIYDQKSHPIPGFSWKRGNVLRTHYLLRFSHIGPLSFHTFFVKKTFPGALWNLLQHWDLHFWEKCEKTNTSKKGVGFRACAVFSGPFSHWGPRWAPRPSLDLPGVVLSRFWHPLGMVFDLPGVVLRRFWHSFGLVFRPHPSEKIRDSDAPHDTPSGCTIEVAVCT